MTSVLIVAAGRGTRMAPQGGRPTPSGDQPTDKLFLLLGGKPVLAHCLERTQRCGEVNEIVVVTRPEKISDVHYLISKFALAKVTQVIEGGAERQDSVWN